VILPAGCRLPVAGKIQVQGARYPEKIERLTGR
jgi:hypothetical protein